jgi:hypothetical protein
MILWIAGPAYLAICYLFAFATLRDHLTDNLLIPLFCDLRLCLTSLLLVLPLALFLSSIQKNGSLVSKIVALVLGLVAPWALLLVWEVSEPLICFTGFDPFIRWVARPLFALLVLFPWVYLLPVRIPSSSLSWSNGLGLFLVATIPCGFFSYQLAQIQKEKLKNQINKDLTCPALDSIYLIGQLEGWDGISGKKRLVDKKNMNMIKKQLILNIEKYSFQKLGTQDKWSIAITWLRLGQSRRNRELLYEIGKTDPLAILFAASLDRFDGNWVEAERCYAKLLNLPLGTFQSDDRFALFEGQAECFQSLGRFRELSSLWEQALVEFPDKIAIIRFNQAMAEASRGRFNLALDYLTQAEKGSAELQERVNKQRRRILANTPACFIKPS